MGKRYIIKKILIPLLLLMFVFSMVIITGCGEEETTPVSTSPATVQPATTTAELTQQQLQKIYNDSTFALQNIDTYKFDMDMDMSMEVTGGDEPGEMTMKISTTGAYDKKANEMFMDMSMKMDMPMDLDTDSPGLNMDNISMKMYILDGYMYMNMDMLGMGDQWIKTSYSEEIAKMYSLNMVDQQIELLESVTDVKLLRYETMDGSECYVLSILPDMKDIMSWIGEEIPADLDTISIDEISEIFKDLVYIVWISRDTGLMLKMDAMMSIDMSSDMFDEGEDFGTMTMDISLTMNLYDHNEPVSIVLPPEAENAMEIPGV